MLRSLSISLIVLLSVLSLRSHANLEIQTLNSGSTILNEDDYVKGRLLVKTKAGIGANSLNSVLNDVGATSVKSFSVVEGLSLYEIDESRDLSKVIDTFLQNENVEYAEPDYIYQAYDAELPNDPRLDDLWGLINYGQKNGSSDADINAEEMWQIEKGSNEVVIGVIDTGIDYTHPDLKDNMWKNPGEIPGNGRDDDRNGYIDDIHGISAIKSSGDPMDDNIHGTHCAGTIGATGNNGVGVVGVAQNIKMIGCKFLSRSGSGATSDALECMEYFSNLKSRSENPVNIVATNNSWGGGGSSQAMYDAIREHERLGILFVAAAGNESNNNDSRPRFPTNYDSPNVLSVAATDRNDRLASFSNYGKKTVDVAAPGVKILSTALNHGYAELSGTSMATPHVTGLAAILFSHFDGIDYAQVKNLIMTGGQKISAAKNTTISGRRIRGADLNGVGSLTCENQYLNKRKAPLDNSNTLSIGQEIFLSAVSINCADPAGELKLFEDDKQSIVLRDNGENGDEVAGDGLYSLNFVPEIAGNFDLNFGDGDVVSLSVYEPGEFSGYTFDEVAYEYESINGEKLGAGDETMHLVKSPFKIHFANNEEGFDSLFISSNGTISFSDQEAPGYDNQQLPSDRASTLIAPFWDDLTFQRSNSDIYVQVIGDAPNRKLVVEWWRYRHYRSSGLGAFQVVFYEDSSDIRFNYRDSYLSNSSYNYGKSATIGVQVDPNNASQHSFKQAAARSKTSILFRAE